MCLTTAILIFQFSNMISRGPHLRRSLCSSMKHSAPMEPRIPRISRGTNSEGDRLGHFKLCVIFDCYFLTTRPLQRCILDSICKWSKVWLALKWLKWPNLVDRPYLPRRALMYVPANSEKMLSKIPQLGADCICLDIGTIWFWAWYFSSNNLKNEISPDSYLYHEEYTLNLGALAS